MLNKLYRATLANLPSLPILKVRELVFNLQYAELNSPEKVQIFSGLGVDIDQFHEKPKFVVPKRKKFVSSKKGSPSKDKIELTKEKKDQLAL